MSFNHTFRTFWLILSGHQCVRSHQLFPIPAELSKNKTVSQKSFIFHWVVLFPENKIYPISPFIHYKIQFRLHYFTSAAFGLFLALSFNTISPAAMNQNDVKQTQTISINKKTWWEDLITKIEALLGEKPFWGSFLLALLLVVPILVIFKFFYQLCDDTYALFLLKGIVLNGTPSEFNFEENSFLCLILKKLYLQCPNIQWYSALFVFTHFLSVWGMLAALNLGTHRFFKNVIFIIGSIVAIERFFIPLQWTTVAAVAAIGGFLLLAAIWRKEDLKFHSFGFFLSLSWSWPHC